MTRPRGGYIGHNAAPAASAYNSAASGVWTLREAESLKRAGTWPIGSIPSDPYFADITLLLRMNGANGSTTFTDLSGTPKAVVAVGNAQVSTAQSKWYGSSGLFDGGGDRLTISDAAMAVGSGNFTIEAWVYHLSLPGGINTLWSHRPNTSSIGGALLTHTNGGLALYIANSTASSWQVLNFGVGLTLTANEWQHIALVRDGNTIRTFVNGTAGSTTTVATGAIGTDGAFVVMSGAASGGQDINGYMQDFRLTKLARYTSAFSAPAGPFGLG